MLPPPSPLDLLYLFCHWEEEPFWCITTVFILFQLTEISAWSIPYFVFNDLNFVRYVDTLSRRAVMVRHTRLWPGIDGSSIVAGEPCPVIDGLSIVVIALWSIAPFHSAEELEDRVPHSGQFHWELSNLLVHWLRFEDSDYKNSG